MINTTIFHRSQHLSETDLLPVPSRPAGDAVAGVCLFCQSTDRKPVWNLQRNPDVELMECVQCHSISASRLPTGRALDEYYQGYYSSGGSLADEGEITFAQPHRLAKHIVKNMPRPTPKIFSILDFGGGDGTIAYLIAKELVGLGVTTVSIEVIDHSKNVVVSDDSRIDIKKIKGLVDIGHTGFTLVIASAVIEHYPMPDALISDLLEKVCHGGVFYARTPTMVPIMKLAKKAGIHLDFTYPGHMHDLGQKFWEAYFQKRCHFSLTVSRPSIVETTFGGNFLRTLAAYAMKFPWHFLGGRYGLVGGWEILAVKK
jgi:hypothetical protein